MPLLRAISCSCSIVIAIGVLLAAVFTSAAAGETSRVRLIAFNDLHGHLEPGDNAIAVPDPQQPGQRIVLRAGGVAHLATAVARLRAEGLPSMLVSGGDLIGASPLTSALFRDEPTIEIMNALGLDLSAAGNHEFDQGVPELQRLIAGGCALTPRGATATCANPAGRYEGAHFPFIAANIEDTNGKLLLPPYVVKTIDGVRIGFIGAVTRTTPGIVMPEGIRGWRFTGEAHALNRHALQLRADGVNAIVAVIHEGGETDGSFNDCDNPRGSIFDIVHGLEQAVDVVLSAHTHRAYNCMIDGRVVIQAASFGRLLSVVDLTIDRASGRVLRPLTRARNVVVANGLDADPASQSVYPPFPADEKIAATVAQFRSRAAPLADRPVGRIAGAFERDAPYRGDSAAGRLIADAQLAATRSNGAQIAFTNAGGIRTDLRYRPAAGLVTYGDIFSMQPFGNTLVTMTLTGAQLKALLESQWRGAEPAQPHFLQPSASLRYRWRADAAPGQRVLMESIAVEGRPLQLEAPYRVTVNSYLAAGGDRMRIFLQGTDHVGGPLDVEALADYLTRRSATAPLQVDRTPRIVQQPAVADVTQ